MEPDGLLWNFGCDPVAGVLRIYGITAAGVVDSFRQFEIADLSPGHDFAITKNHLVFALSPLALRMDRLAAGRPFGASVVWMPGRATRVLVIDKRSWTSRWYEFPPAIVFHLGNAWEDAEGVIRLDCMCGSDPRWMLNGWSLMGGEYEHVRGAVLTLVALKPGGGCSVSTVVSVEGDFPVVDPLRAGRRYRDIVCISRSATRPAVLPVAQAELSCALPVGLHGTFHAT
ncbi:Retinal pigment epithelial membrane protein [Variovorax sp. PBL-E5]|nr:Retinal pigment epithelial membrane protein [Variovorax sp. PBL-E5]